MKKYWTIIMLTLTLAGCGGYNTGILLKADAGFVKFLGNREQISFSIDNGKQFTVDPEKDTYKIDLGRHDMKIYRGGKLIIQKIIVVETDITQEIQLP